jgi:hypothetical protein
MAGNSIRHHLHRRSRPGIIELPFDCKSKGVDEPHGGATKKTSPDTPRRNKILTTNLPSLRMALAVMSKSRSPGDRTIMGKLYLDLD